MYDVDPREDSLYRYGPPPGYGPPAYGPPAYGPAPWWGGRRPTNQLAVVSLVLAFVFAPAALVCGVLARRQMRLTGEGGEGLALAAVIIGGVGTTLMVVGLLLWIFLLASITR
jgi:hypothetical protein